MIPGDRRRRPVPPALLVLTALLLLPVALAAQSGPPPRDPAAEFAALEARLTSAASVALDYHVTAAGAFSADLRGSLELGADGTTTLTGQGTFGGQPVELRLHAADGALHYGRADSLQRMPRPEHLRDALLIGLTRMGILHNLARLTAGAAPDHAEGGVREWVVVDSFMVAPVDTSANVLYIGVDGQPAATALLLSDAQGNPAERRQTVSFPGGQMEVIERYSAVRIVPPQAAAMDVRSIVALLEPEVRRAMLEGTIPSVTMALIDRDGLLWAGAFGQSNLWARTPATVETVYLIASTFKAQSTVALLQQMEAGKFALDDPVRDHLADGIVLRGEDPARPVTFRHLLTHTSGIPGGYGGYDVWGPTAPPDLVTFLRDSLRVTAPPGERVVYSNPAYTLVAYLVERMSGVPYRDYIRERVWEPLGMTSTAFAPTPAMEERLSIPYVLDDDGRPVPTRRTKADIWPAGIIYGTILDQARWARFSLGDGTAPDGTRLLRPETMDSMHVLQYPEHAGGRMGGGWGYEDTGYGLTWWLTRRGTERYFGHSGSVSGYTAFVMGNRGSGHAVVFLTNGQRAHAHLVRLSNLALDLLAERAAGR